MDHPPAPTPRRPMSLKRRIQIGSALLVIVTLALVIALPTLLGTWPGRQLLVRVVNGQLKPGKIQLGRASLSWTRPIELGDVALIDPKGKMVVSARKVGINQGLLALIRSKGDYGTVTVEEARVDIERRADGSIDVLDALAGLNRPSDPRDTKSSDPSVVVVVAGRLFCMKTPEVPGGIVAEAFRGKLTVAPAKAAELTLTLIDKGRSLDLHATYDHRAKAGTAADLRASAIGKGWPVAVSQAGLAARGRFFGELGANRQGGLWAASGAAELREAVAEGPILAGDRVALESIAFGCDVAESAGGWKINELNLKSAVAALGGTGSIPASAKTPTRVEGHVDLAALSRMLPHLIPLRDGLALHKGTAKIEAELVTSEGSDRFQVMASVADLAGEDRGKALALRDPATLSGAFTRNKGIVAVERFSLRAAGLDATATGDLEHGIVLNGTADLAVAESQLREWLDLGAIAVAGQAKFKGDYRHKGTVYEARFASEISGLSVAGLTTDPIARDHVRFEGTADGPSSPLGVPNGWHKGRMAIDGGDARADLHATAEGDALALNAGASVPLTSPIPSRAEARVTFRRSKTAAGPIQDLDELHLSLTPDDPKAAAARVALDVNGRVDMTAGELTLVPLAVGSSAAIGLAKEGIKVGGLNQAGLPVTVRVDLVGDLGALDQMMVVWTGAAPRGLGGKWTSGMTVNRGLDGVLRFDGGMNIDHLVMTTTSRGPVSLATKGGYVPNVNYLHLDVLDLQTRFGQFVVAGNIANLTGDRMIDLSGTIEPRWEGMDRIVATSIEPNAQIRGKGRAFKLAGRASGESASQILKDLTGEIGLDLTSTRAFGMTLGPAPVVLRLGGGKAVFDPIQTTLNDGKVAINADLILDDPNGLGLRVARGSRIDGATINEVVSHDILSYIAPVLSQSTQVRGKVSLVVNTAVVPIVGTTLTQADALARFENVIFQPGAFASELFSMGSLNTPQLKLDQTLKILIADGRVNQSGLSIDLPGGSKVQIDGSVGLDQTLALRAQMPITGQMLGRDKTLNQIVGDTKVTIPIGGTLSRPALDKRAFQVALRDAAKTMVRKGVRNELNGVLDQVIPGAAGAKPGKPGARGSIGNDALKVLEGVGRDLIDPKKKP